MHASDEQTCTYLWSTIKAAEHKQRGKPREMEKGQRGRDVEVLEMEAGGKRDSKQC